MCSASLYNSEMGEPPIYNLKDRIRNSITGIRSGSSEAGEDTVHHIRKGGEEKTGFRESGNTDHRGQT